jgi:hypothetical protein
MDDTSDRAGTPQLGIALVAVGFGFYIALVGLGVLRPPSGAHAPGPVIVAAGLAFLFAGCCLVVQWAGGASMRTGELPKAAPHWMGTIQKLLGLLAAASLATIGSWVAFWPGIRRFSTNVPLVDAMGWGETIGRAAFGFGAIIVWIYVIALVVRSVREFRAAREPR